MTIRVPHYITYFDGSAWVDTDVFEDLESAEDYARATFDQDAIDDGLVSLVPEPDPFEDMEAGR